MVQSIKEAQEKINFDKGVIIGFGAGDITYQLREV
jgi:hypothetical protein